MAKTAKKASTKARKTTTKATPTKAAPAKRTKAPKAAKPAPEPKERDPRLPPAGTKLFKTDREGKKVECVVTDAGAIDYAGKLYKTLSGAACAAAKDLGIWSTSQNGFLFWGVSKAARPTKPTK